MYAACVRSIDLPGRKQQTDATCGAACIGSILAHVGHDIGEKALARLLRTRHDGCDPVDFVRVMRHYRVRFHEQRGMSESELCVALARGYPVVLGIRADDEGHWVVAVGADRRGVIVMDPWIGATRTIAWPLLAMTWWDIEGRPPRPMIRYGLIVKTTRTRRATRRRSRA